jgi:hypothetical protein
MRVRTALVVALVLSAAASSSATAATKKKPAPKSCNMMTDVADDGDWNMAPTVKSKNIDILSGDVATGKTEFVAVLRLAELNFSSDNWATLGYRWTFGATAGGARYEFEYRRSNTGEFRSSAAIAGAGVDYTVGIEGNAIVWRVKRKGVAPLARPNLIWTNLGANSQVMSSTADDAIGTDAKKYKDRAPSCVVAK